MGARRARRGHVYRRRTKAGGWSSWYAVIDVERGPDGQRRQRSKSFGTRAQAYAWLASMTEPEHEGPSLAEWLKQWSGRLGHLRASTRASYMGHVDRYLIPLLGDIPLDQLGVREVEALHAMLSAAGVSTELARRVHATLSAALSEAVRDGLIAVNPCTRVRVPRADRYVPAVWSAGQAARFLHLSRLDPLAGLWRLALLQGLRRGELLGLRWRDVDLEAGTVTVRTTRVAVGAQVVVGPPKSSRSRRVLPLDVGSVQLLRHHRTRQAAQQVWGPDECVFTATDGGPLSPSWVSRRFTELADAAGLPRIRLHDYADVVVMPTFSRSP